MFWKKKTHQNNKRHSAKEKNIVEHNLSFDIKNTRDNLVKTPFWNYEPANHATVELKMVFSILFVRKKSSKVLTYQS